MSALRIVTTDIGSITKRPIPVDIKQHLKSAFENVKWPDISVEALQVDPYTNKLQGPILIQGIQLELHYGGEYLRDINWDFIKARSAFLPDGCALSGYAVPKFFNLTSVTTKVIVDIVFDRVYDYRLDQARTDLIRDLLSGREAISDVVANQLINIGIADPSIQELSPEERAKLFQ